MTTGHFIAPPIRIACISILLLLSGHGTVFAQFSPGELSRAHKELEGSTNCTQCHEVGREISGKKCLACHEEINAALRLRKGYHFGVSSKACVTCHKEHLGATAKTTMFEQGSFNHTLTGFSLSGKHATIECQKCHQDKNIKDELVRKKVHDQLHHTFLGLESACRSCHEDPHLGKFQQECSSCHSTVTWNSVQQFNHAATTFPLEAKHITVGCAKCHLNISIKDSPGGTKFATQTFSDCTPCHSSPHKMSVIDRTCRSCHSTEGWHLAIAKPFEHNRTAYSLIGKHRNVTCEKCHQMQAGQSFKQVFIRPFAKCTDCHADRHNGEFRAAYQNDCARCHTEFGYKPSTYSLSKHGTSRFTLTGGHLAVACGECHRKPKPNDLVFHFDRLNCETCHRDVHRGQFASIMKETSCARCHSTTKWKDGAYDHATAGFPLVGKHATIACSDCHKEMQQGSTIHFIKLQSDCASCHKDAHDGQFASERTTDCARCHSPQQWTTLLFNHQQQSAFSLTGAHERLACKSCHHEESRNGMTLIRYKPLSQACETCHAQEIRK